MLITTNKQLLKTALLNMCNNFKNNHLQSVTIFKAALVHQNINMTESVCCQFVTDWGQVGKYSAGAQQLCFNAGI